ncbi:MAG: Na(+)-translocating NADH-quinone reductase subunit F [Syntrophus sp. PtaU1.Bin208]|nr:MAG: Na(+)-translocating NADH-quinone reductase subunit F [Syntrophus sp. PtaU1.Bin208]
MARVTFQPANLSVEVQNGASILDAAQVAGVSVESPCNGIGACGKCKVRLEPEFLKNISYENDGHLLEEEKRRGVVLSCLAQVKDDLSVFVEESIPKESSVRTILGYARAMAFELDGFVEKKFIEPENVTRIYGGDEFLGVEPGNTADRNYGMVVDIGTTTLVATLVDIRDGKELKTVFSLNPQCLHAQDVLSRITMASEEQGLTLLYSELVAEINRMIDQSIQPLGIQKQNLYEVVYSGNTCMLHLATRVSPSSLGKYPYTPRITGGTSLKAAELGLDISAFGRLYLPPVISAYVGADITSGILASRLHEQQGVALFVDIGTNGEMALASEGRLSATSTAAGPAFEGMNITCGMRADEGAVERFAIGEEGSVAVKTIGGSKAVGLCGSGLVDLVGELVTHGVIGKNGRLADPQADFLPPALKERLVRYNGKPGFRVSDGVYLLQKDIRQVQLAKGAVRAGVEILLRHRGIRAADVDRVLIAGAFGYHLKAECLINIGLLPREFAGRIDFIGNTSKSGGQAFLLNKAYRREMTKVAESVEVLELANVEAFEKVFVSCLNF